MTYGVDLPKEASARHLLAAAAPLAGLSGSEELVPVLLGQHLMPLSNSDIVSARAVPLALDGLAWPGMMRATGMALCCWVMSWQGNLRGRIF
jgi:hypothetical protein